MPRMVLCADFSLAAVAMQGLLNIACSNDRACPHIILRLVRRPEPRFPIRK